MEGPASPLESGKAITFRTNAAFFWQKPAAKTENISVFSKRKKHRIHLVQQDEVPKICFLLIIIGWDESGKAILNEILLSTM